MRMRKRKKDPLRLRSADTSPGSPGEEKYMEKKSGTSLSRDGGGGIHGREEGCFG